MDTKDMILELRTKMGLSQDELAEKVFVTRQGISRRTGAGLPEEYAAKAQLLEAV